MHRIVFISSWRRGVSAVLLPALWQAVAERDDFELAAVCLPSATPGGGPARRLADRLFAWLNRERRPFRAVAPIEPRQWPRRHGVAFHYPDGGDFNAPGFAAALRASVEPTVLLSVYCLQRLGPAWLEAIPHAVNYHNGALPAYRGLRATGWSIYNRESRSGFAFHRMTSELDAGDVLLSGSVPLGPGATAAGVELEKARAAAARLPELLDLLAAGAPGEPQIGPARYYGQGEFDAVTRIGEPAKLSRDELLHRLRAFRALDLRLEGNWYSVDLLKDLAPGGRRRHLCFRTADGAWMAPARIRSWPVPLYRLRASLPGAWR